jgi:acetyl/propionyl-CoA carboxylase alpha subunit
MKLRRWWTYRNAIIEIARTHNVDAIIPGYGFLSENVEFAQAVANAGMVFVGPRSEAIESFGLKHRAREIAVAAGVPIVPGTQGLLVTEDEAVEAANELGYPVRPSAIIGSWQPLLTMICSRSC